MGYRIDKTFGLDAIYKLMKFYEHNKRSLVKTITYESVKLASGFTIVLLYTKKLDITLKIAAVSIVVGAILYFLHERIWNKIHWGKEGRNNKL